MLIVLWFFEFGKKIFFSMADVFEILGDLLEMEILLEMIGIGGAIFLIGVGIIVGGAVLDYSILDELAIVLGVLVSITGLGLKIYTAIS